jgi:pyruvate,water dikinase
MNEQMQREIKSTGDDEGGYVRFFSQIGIGDVPLVGGKNASLGEMYRELTEKGILVPNGFAVTAEAYRHVLDAAGAWGMLRESLDGLNAEDVDDLARRAARARDIVYGAGLPTNVEEDIRNALAKLTEQYGEDRKSVV